MRSAGTRVFAFALLCLASFAAAGNSRESLTGNVVARTFVRM